MTPVTLPGDLVSPVAGPLLRRGAPVVQRDGEVGTVLRKPAREGRWVVAFADGVSVVVLDGNISLDLSDPAGMDLASRWLAAHHGVTVGATAPSWTRSAILGEWALWGHGPEWYYTTDISDPAEAMRAACLAAVGRSA